MSSKQPEKELTQINIRNVPADLAAKFKILAVTHEETQNDICLLALEKFIELYEKKNGPVKTTAKKKSINL